MPTIKDIVQKGRGEFERDIEILVTPLEDADSTHADIVVFKEALFRRVEFHIDSRIIEVLEWTREKAEYSDDVSLITSVIDEIKK